MELHGSVPPVPGRLPERMRGWPGYLRLFLRLAGHFWATGAGWRVYALTASLILLTMGQVAIAVVINAWLEQLFNALEQRALARFLLLIGVFLVIVGGNAAVMTGHLWTKRRLQVRWREWLTARLLGEWMDAGHHYQITQIAGEHDNPDGRIQEDIRISTEFAIDLAHSLLYCALMLISFTQILWALSGPPEISYGSVELYLPGHMVWVALVYSMVGASLALLLGHPLIRTANLRQAAEANFRFGLAHARENALGIALLHGESDERRRFFNLFRHAIQAWNRQTTALSHIFLFSSSWSLLSQVFPILVSAPRYITGAITLGALMQTAQAFQQMAAALSWPIDNLAKAAEWRASVERVEGLHRSIARVAAEAGETAPSRITVSRGEASSLAFAECSLADPDGSAILEAFSARIGHGERVLISGNRDITLKLFKAVAGLWPWGGGRIELPGEATIFFMPQRPYVPAGTLRNAVAYPAAPDTYGDEAMRAILQHVGLNHLASRLGDGEHWEQTLPVADLQRLGFARLLLARPDWVFAQEAADALDPDSEIQIMRMVLAELEGSTIITIGRPSLFAELHRRTFMVVRSDHVAALRETTPQGD